VDRQEGRRPRIAIIGSGFGGLCLGIRLKQAGIDSFTLYEKAERLGGTWRDNRYPGAACDVPSFSYCFSFEQKTDWSRKWAPHDEILAYMDHCAGKYGLGPHLRFGTEIAAARFDADAAVWRLRTADGEDLEAEVLVSCVGQLSRPSVPDIPGLDSFHGPHFHSARWDPELDLAGKRVGVVGNAASAIQLIPPVARIASRLSVFQRSANWMMPRGDRPFSEREKRRFTRHPWLAKLYRWWIWAKLDLRYPLVFHSDSWAGRRMAQLAEQEIRAAIPDPKLQAALIPDYPVGARRILISDDYYPALARENVEVVTSPIARVTADGIETVDGRSHGLDAIVLATGFESTRFLAPMEIQGLDGRSLAKEWEEGAQAYLGLSVPGFPNFFMTYGPNTNLGHNSIIFMIECQANYILQCIERLQRGDVDTLDLRPEVLRAWSEKLQAELGRTVWAETDHSWYKDHAGRITNNWSGTTTRYWWQTRKVDFGRYRAERRRSPA